jgi:ketosteroid isomerase-like protein
METQNVVLVRTLLEAVSRFDPEAMAAAVESDYEFIPIMAALEGRVYRGREGVYEWVAEMKTHWEYFECCPEEFHDLGDRVIAFGHWRARGLASGVEVDGQPATWIAWVRESGLLYRWRTFTDRTEALNAAGISEAELVARPD